MAKKIVWTRTLGEVLQRETQRKNFKSKKGSEYETDYIPRIDAVAIGEPTEKRDGEGKVSGYSYEVYDKITGASFHITAPEKLEGASFKTLAFLEVRGGSLQNRPEGWFSASRVAFLKQQG